jgi:hypothetical protein
MPSNYEKKKSIGIQFFGIEKNEFTRPKYTLKQLSTSNNSITENVTVWHPLINYIIDILAEYKHVVVNPESELNLPAINILCIDTTYLADSLFLDEFAEMSMAIIPSHWAANPAVSLSFGPTLTISHKDIATINAHNICNQQRFTDYQPLDPRVRFFDASIWHRYVPEFPAPLFEEDFAECFKSTLNDLINYWEQGLYYTVAAVSSLEFNLRLLKESYIGKFGTHGHHAVVTPFKFHSERYLKHLNDEAKGVKAYLRRKWSGKSIIESVKWNLLVIDDNCQKNLSTIHPNQACQVSKLDLLKQPLNDLLDAERVSRQSIRFDFPENQEDVIGQCLEKLTLQSYDIIFLDYLLGPVSKDDANRQLGHEFLQKLIQDGNDQPAFKRDFLGKFWIYPISSFPYALNDHLHQVGISPHHSIWNLSNGSDPVTSPYAYQYFLFRFMKQKIRQVFLDEVTLEQMILEVPFSNTPAQMSAWGSYLHNALSRYENLYSIIRVHSNDSEGMEFPKSILNFAENNTKSIETIQQFSRLTDTLIEKSGINRDKIEIARKKLNQKDFSPFKRPIDIFFDVVRECPEEINLADIGCIKILVLYDDEDNEYRNDFDKRMSNIRRDFRVDIRYNTNVGDNIRTSIEQSIQESHLLIFLLSPNFSQNDLLFGYWQQALSFSGSAVKKIFPVRIRPILLDTQSEQVKIVEFDYTISKDSAWVEITKQLKIALGFVFPNAVSGR